MLRDKGNEVWSLAPDATVLQALELMAEKRIGAVVIIDTSEPGCPIGILSERDYARKIVLREKDSRTTPVSDIMTPDPICISPDQTAQDCMTLMTERRIRHLPILEENRLAGLISIGDVVKSVISDHEFAIEQLESYITGS
jgi:CBS domain-containing protein